MREFGLMSVYSNLFLNVVLGCASVQHVILPITVKYSPQASLCRSLTSRLAM